MQAKSAARESFESGRQGLIELSHRIHAHPELGFEEVKASTWLCEALDEAGFAVEKGICDLPTAFRAHPGNHRRAAHDRCKAAEDCRALAWQKQCEKDSGLHWERSDHCVGGLLGIGRAFGQTEKGGTMKSLLNLLFGAIFVFMVVMTIRTGLAVSLRTAWPGYADNPWAMATLYDAYFGFVTFYAWVFYKERSVRATVLWFLLIMGLGNIAMSFYVLIQLFRLKPEEPAAVILRRRTA